MNIYTSIKKVRKQKDMTQGELADKVGITQTYLSQLETGGKRNPSQEVINKICDALEVPYVVLVWFALQENEIKSDRIEAYKLLKPTVDSLLSQIFELKN